MTHSPPSPPPPKQLFKIVYFSLILIGNTSALHIFNMKKHFVMQSFVIYYTKLLKSENAYHSSPFIFTGLFLSTPLVISFALEFLQAERDASSCGL